MTEETTPWYRQFWPWFLIALPATAVVAGIATVIIAMNNRVELVSDETTQLGKLVTRETRQDDTAREMNLHAELHIVPATGAVAVEISTLPDRVLLKLVHATLAHLDQQITLNRDSDGLYRGRLQPVTDGKWQVQLVDPAGQWRLTARYDGLAEHIRLQPRQH